MTSRSLRAARCHGEIVNKYWEHRVSYDERKVVAKTRQKGHSDFDRRPLIEVNDGRHTECGKLRQEV